MTDVQQEHPTPEQLIAYRQGRLGSEAERRIRAHLVACSECGDLLLDLAELEKGVTPEPETTELETRRAWKRQRQRLRFARSRATAGWWVAAAMLVLGVGMWSRSQRLEQQLQGVFSGELSRILVDGKTERSLRQPLPELVLREGHLGLVLLLLPPRTGETYLAAELTNASADWRLWRENLLATENLLVIPLDRDRVPEGEIRVEVFAESPEGRQRVEEFEFFVRFQE